MRKLPLRRLFLSATIASTCFLAAADAPAAPASTASAPGLMLPSEASSHDPRLDLATAQIKTAINLLLAAENPNAKNPDRPFNGHDERAIRFLEFAQTEIENAIAYADASR
jgi:hypothetical protein